MSEILLTNLNELYHLVQQIYYKNKNNGYKFKFSNYKKWIEYINSNENFKSKSNEELLKYITTDKPHYKGLIKRLEELKTSTELKELIKYRKEYEELYSFTSHTEIDKSLTKKVMNIEAVPKVLAEEGERPLDPIEAAKYDLRLVFGFGPSNAAKMVDKGCKLEILFNEWKQFVAEDEYNANLMINNMPIPNNYSQTEFKLLSQEKQHKLKFTEFIKRIKNYEWLSQLTHHQLIGLKYFDHITIKIPREEIIKMEKLLKLMANHLNNQLRIQCCGSYRRGRDRSGDIDALMCHPDLKTKEDIELFFATKNNILQSYVDMLTEYGFIVDHITEGGTSKYMGLCKIPSDEYSIYRRIDIRFVPYYSFGTALLYFTGSKNFNTNMRNVALSKGYTLNEYGLYEYVKNTKTGKKEKGEQFPTIEEEDVFNKLGMKYKTPKERDI